MDMQMRKAIELLLEIAEERRVRESEKPNPEFAGRIAEAIAQVRTLIHVMGDAAS